MKNITIDESANSLRLLTAEVKNGKQTPKPKAEPAAKPADSTDDVYPVPAGYVMLMADGSAATHYMVRHGISIPLRLA